MASSSQNPLNQPIAGDPGSAQSIIGTHGENWSTLEACNRPFIRALFRHKEAKLVNEARLRMAQTETEFRVNALQMAREMQLQAVQEMVNDCLIRGKTTLRKERSKFFLEQTEQLQQEVNQQVENFLRLVIASYERLDRIPVPSLREKEAQRLVVEADRFYAMVDKLMERYKGILDEMIERLDEPPHRP